MFYRYNYNVVQCRKEKKFILQSWFVKVQVQKLYSSWSISRTITFSENEKLGKCYNLWKKFGPSSLIPAIYHYNRAFFRLLQARQSYLCTEIFQLKGGSKRRGKYSFGVHIFFKLRKQTWIDGARFKLLYQSAIWNQVFLETWHKLKRIL